MTSEYLTRGPGNLDASMTLLCLVKQHYLMGCGLQGCLKEAVKLPCDSASGIAWLLGDFCLR